MEDQNTLQLILNELKALRTDVEDLKLMRKDVEELKEGQKAMRADVEDLKEGQKSIRRDISRVDRKLDRLSNDVGDTLAIVTEATDYEMSKLKEAK